MKRLILLIAAVATGVIGAPRARAQGQDLSGVYLAEGVNPDGMPYRGVLEIVQSGRLYNLRWTFPGDDQAYGFGIVSHGALSVSYYGQQMAGVVVYAIEDGKLTVGVWAVAGVDATFSETLTRMPALHDPPLHPPEKPKELGDPKKRIQG